MDKGKTFTRLTLAALAALLLAVFGAQGAFAQDSQVPIFDGDGRGEADEADVDGSGGYCSNNATAAAVDAGDDNDNENNREDDWEKKTPVYQEGDGVGTLASGGSNGDPDPGLGRTDGLQRPRALAGDTGEDIDRKSVV
jgi:hypothetical protein